MSVLHRLVALATLAALAACGPSPGSSNAPAVDGAHPRARAVVLFTVDTLRADRLAPYGNQAYATPAASRLAEQALVFERAYSQADNTNPAVTSFLTGLVPPRHGVLMQVAAPRDEVVSLPGMLKTRDIATGSFVANLCKLQDVPGSVFEEGWDERFCGMSDEHPQHVWGELCVDAALEWIAAREAAGERYLAWIHLMDPHSEYDPPPDQWDHAADPVRAKIPQLRYYSAFEETRAAPPPADLARLNALYDAEVRGSDAQLARVLDFLAALPDGEQVALLFSADHGEELYETWHRIGHGFSVTEGVLRVPLMIRAPGVAPGRVEHPVETLALTPTILRLLGADPPYRLDAPSLLAGRPELPYARSYAEPLVVSLRTADARAWMRGFDEVPQRGFADWRLEAPWFEQPEVYARYADDAPSTPLWIDVAELHADHPVAPLRAAARRTLAEARKGAATMEEVTDPEYLEQLVELGYIEAPGDDR